MKRNLLVGLALLGVFWATTAAGATLPGARRCNGDPDEFQARQVLDEGITQERTALDAGPGRGGGGEGSRKPMPSRQAWAHYPVGRGRPAMTLSGKHFFLER